MKRLTLAVPLILIAGALAAAEPPSSPSHSARLLRHPTYSQGQVAFGYLSDLWIAQEDGSAVRRLTDHKARDIFPRFSPDGHSIAFSSNRDGNYDVFVISVHGGKPRQLTFHSADDTVVGWTPDGQQILFASTRNQGVFPTVTTLFQISVEGGIERPVATDWGSWASYSPDGSKLAFTRHPGVWSRQHYRGSYAVDLWLMDLNPKRFTKLSDSNYQGNSLWPMFGRDGQIYFVCDRLAAEKDIPFGGPEVMKSANNIWKISETGGAPVQITHHRSGRLFFPCLSADGQTIVYEENFGLWKLDLKSGRSTEIRLTIDSDLKENELVLRTIQSEADSFHLSPSTKRAALTTHGEIFSIATDRGEAQRVTESPWREQNPKWSPDGKWIAFVSDRTGREEIWMADERNQQRKQLSDSEGDKSALTWAPDSKSLLWSGSDRKVLRVFIDTGKIDELVASDVGPIANPRFSPDGKWISYAKPDPALRSHIHVKNLETSEERRIDSVEFITASNAHWTPDGKKLLLLGGIGAPGMASLNRTITQLYSIALTRQEKNPDEDREINTEAQAQSPGDGSRRGPRSSTSESGTSGKVEVKIEWENLERRVLQVTRMAGSVTSMAPAPDSRTYAFVALGGESDEGGSRPALYTIADDGSRLTTVTQGTPPDSSEGAPRGRGTGRGGFGDPQWSKDGRTIFFLQNGGLYTVAAPTASAGDSPGAPSSSSGRGGRGRGAATTPAPTTSPAPTSSSPRRISFTVRLETDEVTERRQVFEEAWRVMKHRFYDPKMHGVNWAAMKETYAPLLADVRDSDELHAIIMQMIGELNASHTGISGGGDPEDGAERIQNRYPGFDLEPNEAGFYKVGHIYHKGPADHDYLKLQTGNYLLSVNGRELKTSENYWKVFRLIPGRKFEFTVNTQPETAGAWTVSIEPLTPSAQVNLEYERWVRARQTMVETLSRGEIGYLHIRAMDATALRKFQRDLLENRTKKALIIDERFNGGGGIDQELLAILNQRTVYQTWRSRDSVAVTRPVQAFFGPMVVLQNERSASDAEMFPDGFRRLGLGKIVGTPTYGAVIGTGAFRLMDGSTIRTPGVGVFTAQGENMENYGVQPDVLVDNAPEDFLTGHDRQVEKALEVLRAQLK